MSIAEKKAIVRRFYVEVVAGFRQHVNWFRGVFPDLQISVDDLIAEGGRVVAFWTVRSTRQGALWSVAPTGRPVTTAAISVIHVTGGRISEYHARPDRYEILKQLDALPAQMS